LVFNILRYRYQVPVKVKKFPDLAKRLGSGSRA
jgi:hypothetical protein